MRINKKTKKKTDGLWIFLALGLLYFIWLKLAGHAIPCMFRKITGWLCPGCGITTMIVCMANLDFQGAWEANPFLFATLPLILPEFLYVYFRHKKKEALPEWNNTLLVLYTIALCIFGVLRNF